MKENNSLKFRSDQDWRIVMEAWQERSIPELNDRTTAQEDQDKRLDKMEASFKRGIKKLESEIKTERAQYQLLAHINAQCLEQLSADISERIKRIVILGILIVFIAVVFI